MRRIVVEVPDFVGLPGDDSPLRQKLPSLARMAEAGHLFRLASLPPVETPEALYLGLGPGEGQMAPGPLIVSALGADPPERSTHFRLSLMEFTDGVARRPSLLPSKDDLAVIWRAAKRLDTKQLTLLQGEDLEHALVWEALGDLATRTPAEVEGKQLAGLMPEGDGDRVLRRLIDDSINLLSELEMNARRLDEGLPTFNLLWPWGQGVRRPVPNLILRRGEPATVESASLRMAGLTRLTGYRHGDRTGFGRGLNTKFEAIARAALGRAVSIVVIEAFRDLRESPEDRSEELGWLAREFDARFLAPLVDRLAGTMGVAEPMRISLLAPSTYVDRPGLGLEVGGGAQGENTYPFDERALEEKRLVTVDFAERVDRALLLNRSNEA